MTRFLNYKSVFIVVGVLTAIIITGWLLYLESIKDKSILTDFPCAAPCWQGITPGTSVKNEEIVEILEAIPGVGDIWQNSLPQGKAVLWFWKSVPWEKSGYNSIFLAGGIVDYIRLDISFDLTVKNVLRKYGSPEVISITQGGLPEKNYMIVNMYYPTQGVEFRARVPSWTTPFVLGPDTEIFEAVYAVPSESIENWEENFDLNRRGSAPC